MTNSHQSVIIGLHRMGATIEQIYYEMGFDELGISVIEVQKIIERYIPLEVQKYNENERYNILQKFKEENIITCS